MGWDKQIAIVGADESDQLGKLPGKSAIQLHAEGALNALADAGLTLKDVDGVFTAGPAAPEISGYLGLNPRYVDGTMIGGCSFMALVEHAAAAIRAGLCEVALITHGESGRSRVTTFGRGPHPASPLGQFEAPYGVARPVESLGLALTRHMHEYGTTPEMLAEVAVATRKWAQLNPKALMREPLTIADVLASPYIAYPLHLYDCCLVTDGGGALVLTTTERARDLRQPPALVLGTGEAVQPDMVSQAWDLPRPPTWRQAGKRAFALAGLTPQDIDHAMLYDAFTFTPIFMLEALGFCQDGEGGRFVSHQRTAPGGDFPMNTNGGGLSYTHTGMYGMFALIEAVRQVRGQCGERQVPNCEVSLAFGPGGYFWAAACVILGKG